ncbi:MAG: ATP-binding cassette domain-containing protein [Anaerolineaceae bacterium]|nr:ATP-binding cassette domain-containing protein [Anaerolineaceae bacterium]
MDPFESQIDARSRRDEEIIEKAYEELFTSVSGSVDMGSFRKDDMELFDRAVTICLKHIHAEPGTVPKKVTDPEKRLEYLCRPGGIMYRPVRLEKNWYKNAFGVMLGNLKNGQPAALIPRGMAGYEYVDPATEKTVRVRKKNASDLETEAVCFYYPLPPKSLGIRDLIFWILSLFETGDWIFVILAAIAAVLMGLLPAWVNNLVYGTVIPAGKINLVFPVTVLLLGVGISRILIDSIRSLIRGRVAVKLRVYTESAAYSRVLMLPPSFFRKFSSGNLSQRISQISVLVQQLTELLLGAGLTFLLSIFYLFQISRYASALTVQAFLAVFIQAFFTIYTALAVSRYEKLSMDANAVLSGAEAGMLHGIQKIKLSGAENRAFARWAHAYSAYARAEFNRPVVLQALPAFVNFIGMLGSIVICYFAGKAQMTVTAYMAFSAAYGQMSAAILSFADLASQAVKIGPVIEMTAPILEAVPEISSEKVIVRGLDGSLDVRNVSFRYNKDSRMILQDLSFSVRPGEYVAIVGRSGCGKSTLIRLLLGFEKPERGSVVYGPAAYDTEKTDLRSLRRHIGTVMQNGSLFSADIYSNIILASPSSSVDDAWKAAELAGIAEDIRKMPMGMNTLLSENSGSISGGQKQRLMIARAICGSPKILILDEATSALDNITQKHVTDSLETIHCTRIVIAHRLSTVQHCDRILVLDSGKIAEQGTYEELMEKGGLFADLVARQKV